MRLGLRLVFFLLVAGALGLLGLAVFSELPAPTAEVSVPVEAE